MIRAFIAAYEIGGPMMYPISLLSFAFVTVFVLQLTKYKESDLTWLFKALFICVALCGLVAWPIGLASFSYMLDKSTEYDVAWTTSLSMTLNVLCYAILVETGAAALFAFIAIKRRIRFNPAAVSVEVGHNGRAEDEQGRLHMLGSEVEVSV